MISQIIRESDGQGKKLDKPEVAPTKGMAVGDAGQRLSGAPGSTVKLMIERPGKEEPFEVVVTRGPVEEETVFGVRRKDDDTWDWRIDAESRIGYIRLTQFNRNSAPGIRKAMKDLEARVGRSLLVRSARGVTLTVDGTEFLGYARQVVEQVLRGLIRLPARLADAADQSLAQHA